MKCDNCGFMINPGDQKCIKCGARINPMNVIIPGVETIYSEKKKKKLNNKILILVIIGIIVLTITIYFIVKVLLKR